MTRILCLCHDVRGLGERARVIHPAGLIGARVGAKAGPGETRVSSRVKDLTARSGLTFEDRGEHDHKGVPDRWHLYQVVGS